MDKLSLYCQDNLPPFRYVIVQLPRLNGYLVACEIEVIVRGKSMSNINIVIFTTQADRPIVILLGLHAEGHQGEETKTNLLA